MKIDNDNGFRNAIITESICEKDGSVILFTGFVVFQKMPVKIIIRFDENNMLGQLWLLYI